MRWVFVIPWLGVLVPLGAGCSETSYNAFDALGDGACAAGACGAVDSGVGGGAQGPGATGGGGGSTGGAGGGATGGTGGGAPTEPDPCQSRLLPEEDTVQLRFVASGLCLAVGASTLIGPEEAFLVTTVPCAETLAERWTLRPAEEGALEIRSESTDYNLDVRLAATNDGTPLVTYQPHALYNQRFFASASVNGAEPLRLAPRHSPSHCLSEELDPDGPAPGRNVEIWPCHPADDAQLLEVVPCE